MLDATEGLRGYNVTCNNSFPSHELTQQLLKRNQKNKPELPPDLLAPKRRDALSSKFTFIPTTTLVSYIPKIYRNVVLLSTLHRATDVSDGEDRKPAVIPGYNHKKWRRGKPG